MSDQGIERIQINIRLNEAANRQLQDLADHLNVPRSAVMLQALSAYHRSLLPQSQPPHHPPPPPTGTPPPPTGKG